MAVASRSCTVESTETSPWRSRRWYCAYLLYVYITCTYFTAPDSRRSFDLRYAVRSASRRSAQARVHGRALGHEVRAFHGWSNAMGGFAHMMTLMMTMCLAMVRGSTYERMPASSDTRTSCRSLARAWSRRTCAWSWSSVTARSMTLCTAPTGSSARSTSFVSQCVELSVHVLWVTH